MTDSETTQSTEKDQPAAPKHPWTELKPDRFRLLRLAPLPTERDGGARPLRFVELAQLERHTPEQSLLRMFINIPTTSWDSPSLAGGATTRFPSSSPPTRRR